MWYIFECIQHAGLEVSPKDASCLRSPEVGLDALELELWEILSCCVCDKI